MFETQTELNFITDINVLVKGRTTRQRKKSNENLITDSMSETTSKTKRQRKSNPVTLQEPTDPSPKKVAKLTPSKRQPRKPMGRRSKSLPKRNMAAYSASLAQEINNDTLNLQMDDSPEKEKVAEETPPNNEKKAKRSSNKITPKKTVRPLILRKSGRKSLPARGTKSLESQQSQQQENSSSAPSNAEKENDENVNIENDHVREKSVTKASLSLKHVDQLGSSSKPRCATNIPEQLRKDQKRTKNKDRLTGMCTLRFRQIKS